MDDKTKSLDPHRPAGRRRIIDRVRRRALLCAMRGALRRSVVLLPVSEEDDLLQRFLQDALGAPA
ncbi:MAG TPA: hypothetical protein VFB01_10325 [Burkholderiales bacterium]|nr:hypothetical protein [Burkholderiales bacterium]